MKAKFYFVLIPYISLCQLFNNHSKLSQQNRIVKNDLMRQLLSDDYNTFISNLDTKISDYYDNKITQGTDCVLEVYSLTNPPPANNQISSFNLGYCESIIETSIINVNSEEIVIAKFDIDRPDSISPQIEYKLYLKQLMTYTRITSLKECELYNTTLAIPITNKELIPQYDLAKQYLNDFNVDILNSNHALYIDHCFSFAPDGIDIILKDRHEDYYKSPPLCEPNCNYQRIDFISNKVICKCPIKVSLNTHLTPNAPQALSPSDEIYFQIIGCTKLLTYWRTFSNNTGMLVIITIIVIQVITIFSFLFCGMPKLNQRLRESKISKKEPQVARKPFYNDRKEFVNYFGMKEQLDEKAKMEKRRNVFFDKEEFFNVFEPIPEIEEEGNKDKTIKDNQTGIQFSKDESYFYRVPAQRDNYIYYSRTQKDEIIESGINNKNNELKHDDNNKRAKDDGLNQNMDIFRDQISLSIISSDRPLNNNNNMYNNLKNPKPIMYRIDTNSNNKLKSKANESSKSDKNNNNKSDIKSISESKQLTPNSNQNANKKIKIGYNDCRYEYSIQHDRRNCLVVFWYTITEREIFCAICSRKSKYELKSIQFSFCLLNLALDLFFNCFYYSDNLISIKYRNNGVLPLPTLIIKSIISSLSTGFINCIIGFLFIYVKYFEVLSLEYIPENKYRVYSLNFLQAIQKKIMTAFCFELIILTFCFYYTTIFCGVYPKTRNSLFIGFGVSLLFELSFIVLMSIIVSCMRYCSIRCQKRKMYYSSIYIKNRM